MQSYSVDSLAINLLAVIESYELVENKYVLYFIRVKSKENDNTWMVTRRFSDFDHLQWALRGLGPPWNEAQLPPKRWWNRHEPAFLEERKGLLQQYIEGLMSLASPPPPIRDFLEVDAHMGVDDLIQEFGGMEGLPDANAEHGRLRAIVDDTSAALIDVSRVGNDDFILDPDATKTQRLTVLREATVQKEPAIAGGAVTDSGLRLPVPSPSVQTSDGLLDTLTRAPAVPTAVQTQLVERCGLALTDTIREASVIEIGEGHDLVCHMQPPPQS